MSTRSFADELSFLDSLLDRNNEAIRKYADSHISNILELLKNETLRQEMIRSLEAKIYNWPWSDPDKQINALAEQIFIQQEFFVQMLDGSPNLKYRALMVSPAGLRFLQRKLGLERYTIKDLDEFLRIYNQVYYTRQCRIYNDVATCARKAGRYNDVEAIKEYYFHFPLDVLRGAIAGSHLDLIKQYARRWRSRPWLTMDFNSTDGFYLLVKDLETAKVLHRTGITPRTVGIFRNLDDPTYDIQIILFYLGVFDIYQLESIPGLDDGLVYVLGLALDRQNIDDLKKILDHPRLAGYNPRGQLLVAFWDHQAGGVGLKPEFHHQVAEILDWQGAGAGRNDRSVSAGPSRT